MEHFSVNIVHFTHGSVFVSGGDVYIGGSSLWKNGQAQTTGITGNRTITSVFVTGNDVYAVARHSSVSWRSGDTIDITVNVNGAWISKNGNAERLDISSNPNLILAGANSVYAVGNDVYVAGDVDGIATLWRNGEQYMIGDQTAKESGAFSVFVRPKQ